MKHQSGRRNYYRLISFQVDPELDVAICEAAKIRKVTLSDFIREACIKSVKNFLANKNFPEKQIHNVEAENVSSGI